MDFGRFKPGLVFFCLAQEKPDTYQQIRNVVQLAIPFFDDFVLKPQKLPTERLQFGKLTVNGYHSLLCPL